MDMIDMLPPGLYEAIFEEVGEDTANRDLIEGKYLFRLEPRTLDDIRELGENSPEDDLKFAAVDADLRHQPQTLRDLCRALRPRGDAAGFGEWAAQDASQPDALRDLLRRESGHALVADDRRAHRKERTPAGEHEHVRRRREDHGRIDQRLLTASARRGTP